MAIFADQHVPPIAIVATIVLLIVLGVLALYLLRGYEALARRSLRRKYDGLAIFETPQPGGVVITYHTYHGLIAWFTQTPHQVALPPDDARKLLGRLLRFNLLWGLFTYGALFIPPLAIMNYFAQRRSIAAQESAGMVSAEVNSTAPRSSPTSLEPNSNPYSSPETSAIRNGHSLSLFHRVIGLICAGLCVLFSITTVAAMATAKGDGVIGGVFVATVMGLISREFLGKRT